MQRLSSLLLGFVVATVPSSALLFEPLTTPSGPVLLIRDCGSASTYFHNYEVSASKAGFSDKLLQLMKAGDADRSGKPCAPWEKHFAGRQVENGQVLYPGDASQLQQRLNQQNATGHPFREVWLFSGGGNVDAAVHMARTFRNNHFTVRLKTGFDCVSACTIAFMGGYFRYMEDGATYQVHSASVVSSGLDSKGDLNDFLKALQNDLNAGLRGFAADEQITARFLAFQMVRVFQNTLNLPLQIHLSEDDDDFDRWSRVGVPTWTYLASASSERSQDISRLQAEGLAAAQDILMRLERECMQMAISDLEQIKPNLGARAGAALEMLKLMYMTSIQETATLSRNTMLQRGYLTEEIKLP